MTRALMPNMLTPQDLEPNWEWRDKLPAWGHTSVDFERRIDHDRLHRYRLARTRQSLQNSNAGSLLSVLGTSGFFASSQNLSCSRCCSISAMTWR